MRTQILSSQDRKRHRSSVVYTGSVNLNEQHIGEAIESESVDSFTSSSADSSDSSKSPRKSLKKIMFSPKRSKLKPINKRANSLAIGGF